MTYSKTIAPYHSFSSLSLLCATLVTVQVWNPTAQSPGRVSVTQHADQIKLSWETIPLHVYQIYHRNGHKDPWKELLPEPIVAEGYAKSHMITIDSELQLYRVAQVGLNEPAGLVWIPAGTFTMGSPLTELDRDDNEGPQMVVTLTRGFWMGKRPVTQAEYEDVMGYNPSFFIGIRNWPSPGIDYGNEPDRPVEQVEWDDAVAFCAALTERERAAGRIPAGTAYRLPTEAEWEYACRAGSDTRFWFGDDAGYEQLADFGWYNSNSNMRTQPVGQKQPNAWGLYDLHGNVWEWCQDWYGPYPGGNVVDPQGPSTGSYRVLRGGTFANIGAYCRSANRDTPRGAPYDFGFRIVLASTEP
jgi:formylglycine-generating enzyme required for sulfatase activity